jgi:putative endonuclease
MAEHNILGKKGEDIAVRYLEEHGYSIIDRNWRSGHFELDIVAEKDGTMASIEVKTRRNDVYMKPVEAVSRAKIRRIVMATDAYIRRYCINMPVRFDIISITAEGAGFRVEHYQDAFMPPMF